MTATIAEIEDGLLSALRTIDGLEGYGNLPDAFNVPCALAGCSDVTYHGASKLGNVVHQFDVMLLVARSDDVDGQALLDSYMSASGTVSIRQVLESGDRTLGGIVDELVVEHGGSPKVLNVNGVSYISIEFAVTVYA